MKTRFFEARAGWRKTATVLTAAIFGVAIAACSSPTAYKPEGKSGRGYAEQKLAEDRYRVTFKANYLTDRETVENALLYRAAEVTQREGAEHFVLVDKNIESISKVRGYGAPTYGFAYHHGFFYPRHFTGLHSYYYGPYSGSYFGDFDAREYKRYEASAEIQLRPGPAPSGQANAYDASDVLTALGPVIRSLNDGAANDGNGADSGGGY
ncbi:MAG: hypothetical protein Tsb0016_09180 [Sphingomonadales bacterium]